MFPASFRVTGAPGESGRIFFFVSMFMNHQVKVRRWDFAPPARGLIADDDDVISPDGKLVVVFTEDGSHRVERYNEVAN